MEPVESRLPAFLSAFEYRDFRRLWLGAFLSSIGTWTQDVALAWLIHTRFADPRYLGYRAFAAEAPLIAFMLIGGATADRVNRRLVLLSSQGLQMLFAATLAVLYATDTLGLGAILSLAVVTGLAQSQSAPTYQAVLTSLVPPAKIQSAVALNSLQFNLSRAIGPALAGLALAHAGTGFCFTANAVSYLAVIVSIHLLKLPPPSPSAAGQSLARSLEAGVSHVWHSRELFGLTLLAGLGSFLAFPLITYLPVVASDSLGAGAGGFSRLLTSFGLGAILGALTTAQLGTVPGRGQRMLLAMVGYGIAAVLAVLSSRIGVAMSLLAVAGFCLVTAFSTLNSLVQENAPPELKGRVLSIWGLAFRGGGPLGSLVAGFLVRQLGVSLAMAVYAGTLVLVAAAVFARSSRFRTL